VRLWKLELQERADELGTTIAVYQLPPGTRAWNKTERRLLSFITQNWGAKLLDSCRMLSCLIARSTAAVPPKWSITVNCRAGLLHWLCSAKLAKESGEWGL
jgi:hypothetical protein